MVRWEADSRGRLEQAAMSLYAEHGFENTTVAQIAERAGLTERTFFRHFADKREVLFAGGEALRTQLVSTVVDAPRSLTPLDSAAMGVEAIAVLIPGREVAQRRQEIIAASAELQERELIKLASLSEALAGALRERGIDEAIASLTADVAIAVFRVAFTRWVDGADGPHLSALIRDSFDALKDLAAGGSARH